MNLPTLETCIQNPVSEIEKKIMRLGPWFHNIHLPDGTNTAPNHPLGDFPKFKWDQIKNYLPQDLEGRTVLDIGCNAGYYSLEFAKRGAQVTAIDIDAHYLKQAKWTASLFGLSEKIEFIKMQVYNLPRLKRKFDIVLFMGVFYHLRYPIYALDIVTSSVRDTMVFQSLSMQEEEIFETPFNLEFSNREELNRPGWPKMSFVEKYLAGDATNWWIPNKACMEALLRSSGLNIIASPADEIYICRKENETAAEKHLSQIKTGITSKLRKNLSK